MTQPGVARDQHDLPAQGPVRVGIAGLGRSGWNIHAAILATMPQLFHIVAVVDPRPERRAEAEARFHCRSSSEIASITDDPEIDLAVIATPNHLHAAESIAAMQAGKHVLCEKPMAIGEADASAMIAASARTGRVLTVFQNRRFEPAFQKVHEIIASGVLGRIIQIRLTLHSFSRRWDWQTLKEFGGGTLNNAGSHFLDQLLTFFPTDMMPDVFCHTDRALTLGDAEDHVVVMLRAPHSPLVQMELTSSCAYPQDNWLIMGDRGALHGRFDRLEWKVAKFDQLPPRTLEREPMPDRTYNSDKVEFDEQTWQVPADQSSHQYTHRRFYENLFQTLHGRAHLVVTPQQILRQMKVLDACRASLQAFEKKSGVPPK